MSDFLEVARPLYVMGFSPIPIKPRAKKPPLIKWEQYQNRRPTEDEIKEWADKWPSSNIALVCGKSGGLVVLDVDGPEGEASLKQLEPFPKTPEQRTGGGGRQFLFAHPGNGTIANFTRRLPGIDCKADGGYILCPPSIHPSGNAYEWIVSPFKHPLALLPQSILNLIETSKEKPVSKNSGGDWVIKTLATGIKKGQRNDMASKLAGFFLRKYTSEIVFNILRNWNTNNKPPLSEQELLTIINSIKTYHPEATPQYATFNQILQEGFIETPYYIEPKLLGPTDILIFGGDPGIGKTLEITHLACCLSSGENHHRLKIPNPVTTYLLQLELSYERWKERHWKLLQIFKGKMRKELIVEKQPERVPLSKLFDHVRDIGAGVLIIDPWTDYWGQETKDQAKAMEQLKNFCRDEGVAAILTHHRKKAGYQELREHRGADSLYGSGALRRFASTIILMNMIDEEDGLTTVLEFDKTRNTNRFQPILEPRWLRLDSETTMFKEQDVDVGAKIRLVIGNSVDGVLSFTEIRKALGCHQMVVTRWLKREIKQGHIQKVRGGYRNTIKGG